MLELIPSQATMVELVGRPLYEVWQALCSLIDEKYDMERLWNTGGKKWTYEYKYRRGGKTLSEMRYTPITPFLNGCYGGIAVFRCSSSQNEKRFWCLHLETLL